MAYPRRPKGGSSFARAQRAKRVHARRQARLFDSTHYKGGKKRVKRNWLGF